LDTRSATTASSLWNVGHSILKLPQSNYFLDRDFLESFTCIEKTCLLDDSWIVSSQWLNVQPKEQPVACSYGNLSCRSPPFWLLDGRAYDNW
jgi:hypothetical protein